MNKFVNAHSGQQKRNLRRKRKCTRFVGRRPRGNDRKCQDWYTHSDSWRKRFSHFSAAALTLRAIQTYPYCIIFDVHSPIYLHGVCLITQNDATKFPWNFGLIRLWSKKKWIHFLRGGLICFLVHGSWSKNKFLWATYSPLIMLYWTVLL